MREKISQLRSHIPLSAPGRREPADGSETSMRVSAGFEPAWFHRRCDVDFAERWHTDPYYRHDALVTMAEALRHAFPDLAYWSEHDDQDLWTLSGCYGILVIPMVFGCAPMYGCDRWPLLSGPSRLSLEELAKLDSNALLHGPLVEQLFRQMDIIEAEAGKVSGYLNWQGILNNAFHLRGQDIFVDTIDQPEMVHQLFSLICDVMIGLAQQVQERQRLSGFYIDQLDVSNCTMNLLSPRAYGEFVLPYDTKIAEKFEHFGVHTCNWNVTPYLSQLAKLPKMEYLDMGIMSDLGQVRELFPCTRRAVLYSPVTLADASVATIQRDLQRIHQELSPCDVVMADIQHDTPDRRLNEFLHMCRVLEVEPI